MGITISKQICHWYPNLSTQQFLKCEPINIKPLQITQPFVKIITHVGSYNMVFGN
jgi:hypothetical protein